jgi:DNA modification methylase
VMSNRFSIAQGDCLEVMKRLKDNCIDAVVTDPPYGLSKEPDMAEVLRHWLNGDDYKHGSPREGLKNCASNLGDISIVYNSNNTDSKPSEELITLTVSVSTQPMRVRLINIDHGRLTWEIEVSNNSTIRHFKDMLVNERYAKIIECLRDGQFYLRKRKGFSGCVGICTCCAEPKSVFSGILIGLSNNMLSDSKGSGSIVASGATEVCAMLTFDPLRRTATLHPTEGAEKFDADLLLIRTESVGTPAGTSCLPTKTETNSISNITDSTNRAITFNLVTHNALLDRLQNPIITQKGFMGKTWDSFVPGPSIWREVYRVLKPGGHVLSFFGTRTYDMGVVAMRLAGFEIRDQIDWLYGSGFPKSHNLGDGRGTALKPAHEPIVLARKPLAAGTVASNVMEYGTGALNIDGCRIPASASDIAAAAVPSRNNLRFCQQDGVGRGDSIHDMSAGRWPANVIHDGSDEVEAAFAVFRESKSPGTYKRSVLQGYGTGKIYSKGGLRDQQNGHGDTGTASRFFYCAKASKADRDDGLSELPAIHRPNGNKWTDQDYHVQNGERTEGRESDPRKNMHPTVKPTVLMRYLCRLITPPDGVILDPFCGTGSTGRGALLEGFRFLGIEMDADYARMAELRIMAILERSEKDCSTPFTEKERGGI